MIKSDKNKTIKMYTKVLVVLMAVSLMPMVLSRTRRYSKMQANTLYKIRCDLKCIDISKEAKPMVSLVFFVNFEDNGFIYINISGTEHLVGGIVLCPSSIESRI